MKKIRLLFAVLLTITFTSFAQAPHAINYQAVARSTSGALLADTTVNVEFIIHDTTTTGTVVFDETYTNVATNHYGTFTVALGDNHGTISAGSFDSLRWAGANKYLEVKLNGNSVSTTQLVSVPYALYSEKTGVLVNTQTGATVDLSGSMQPYDSVTITVPAAGTIVVDAGTWVRLIHTNGTLDELNLTIGTTPTDAGTSYENTFWDVPAAMPSYPTTNLSFKVRRIFHVTAAGTYTYYLNGSMPNGYQSGDVFWFNAMSAEFH